jgi:outer membrane protein OmpA-like peptidoglycan-associated protein
MKKILVLLCVLTLGAVRLTAQDANTWGPFESTPAWANVYLGVDGGVQTVWGNSKLSPLRHNVDIQMGKWWNPFFSTRLKFEMGRFKTSESSSEFRNRQFSSFTWHGDAVFNMTNILGGYRQDRRYEFSTFLGIGAEHSWGAGSASVDYDKRKATQPALFAGVKNTLRLTPAWGLNLELQGALMPKEIEGETDHGWRPHGQLSLMVGVAYTIGPRGFKGVSRTDCTQHQKRITQLERELNTCTQDSRRAQQELQNLRAAQNDLTTQPTSCSNCAVNPPSNQVQVPALSAGAACDACSQAGQACGQNSPCAGGNVGSGEKHYMPEMAVFFDINSATISARETLQLQLYANAIKAARCPYIVVGYADIQTGSLAYNEKLAQRRAEAVVHMLVTKFGVSPSLLKATVGNLQHPPFTDTIYNRTAIIRVP